MTKVFIYQFSISRRNKRIMKKNKFKVELPLVEPQYSTYHCQGIGGAIIQDNPSIRNWYLSHVIILCCNSGFISGKLSTPVVGVMDSEYWYNPSIEITTTPFKSIESNIIDVICSYIDKGYYVVLEGIDDFYVQGKSCYNSHHMQHDGLICGYDDENNTFSMYAYDNTWEYRVFKTPQKCIIDAVASDFVKNYPGRIRAIKIKRDYVKLNLHEILLCLKWYNGATFEQYPPYKADGVYGIVVHDYIAIYLQMLISGIFTYEQVDTRIFRMIWEHKKVLLEAIKASESELGIGNKYSALYAPIVAECNKMRMIYAMYCAKRQDSKLETLYNMILRIKDMEKSILEQFVVCLDEKLNNTQCLNETSNSTIMK